MGQVWRGLVAVVALFNIVLGLGFLLDPASSALIAAWRNERGPLAVPIALLALALVGRSVSLIADGAPATAFPPMIVEAVMVAILLGARRDSAKPL